MSSQQAADKKVFTDLIHRTQVSSKISRLIAQENITVEYVMEAATASFDIVRRVLQYPYSLILEDDIIHDLLMSHEIGHARHTKTAEEMRERSEEGIFELWNIIEDIRIERLMKRDYPGLATTFQIGYQRLYQRGFFGPRHKLEIGTFATRMNFFCKAGPITASFIKFSKEEAAFMRRCMGAETEEQVHALTLELAVMAGHDAQRSRELLLDRRRQMEIERQKWRAYWNEGQRAKWGALLDDELDEDENVLDGENDFDDEGDEEEQQPVMGEETRRAVPVAPDKDTSGGGGGGGGGGGSLTQRQAEGFVPEKPVVSEEETQLTDEDRQRFQKIADELSQQEEKELEDVLKFQPLKKFEESYSESKVLDSTVIMFESVDKRELNMFDARGLYRAFMDSHGIKGHYHCFQGENSDLDNINLLSVNARKNLKKAVDYLARQFDAKKAAIRAKHAIVSTSGQLDMNRAFAFKYSDDIFLKKTHIRDAKNHGIVLLLDASASIMDNWEDMVKQVLLITEFCRKVQIPFKVFIFGQQDMDKLLPTLWKYRPNPVPPKTPEEKEKDKATEANDPSRGNSFLGYGRDENAACEVLSSEMTSPEYRTMAGALLARSFFCFGGTPTTNAMLNIEANINEFFHRYNVSIKKLMVITDGGAGDGRYDFRCDWKRVFVSDPKTRKNYYLTDRDSRYSQIPVDIVTKIFKDRHNIDTIYIGLGHRKDVKSIKDNGRVRRERGMAKDFGLWDKIDTKDLYREYAKQKFMFMETPLGVPTFFVQPTAAETSFNRSWYGEKMVWDEKLRDYRKQNTKEIAEAFTEGLASMKTSQTFLSILMKYIAIEAE